jgi:hypothetical protein
MHETSLQAPFFMFYPMFVNRFNASIEMRTKLEKKNSQFDKFLMVSTSPNFAHHLTLKIEGNNPNLIFIPAAVFRQSRRFKPGTDQLDLSSLLVMPIQRIPRYVLLLKELLKYTPESHVDFNSIHQALSMMEETANMMNEKKREAENLEKLDQIQSSLSGDIRVFTCPLINRITCLG